MVLWHGSYTGRLPRINEKLAALSVKGKGRVYITPMYRKCIDDMAMSFASSEAPITEPANVYIEVGLWSRIDSDAPVKAIFDALEKAGVLENDKLVRDFVVLRQYHKRDEPDWVEIVIVDEAEPIAEFPEIGKTYVDDSRGL